MPRAICGRLARPAAGAFLTLLALGLLSSGSARAGCLNHRPSEAHFDALVLAGAMPEAADYEAASPPKRMPTCDGPMCSRGPAAPPISSITAPDGQDSWACLLETLDPGTNPPRPLPHDAIPARPSDRDTSIFHPPRIAPI